MKEDNRIQIMSVYDELCKRDPTWNHVKMLPQFRVLYDGWRAVELKHKRRSKPFFTHSWQRGWLPIEDGERFRRYAMQ